MGGHGKTRWKISSLYHRSPSTPGRTTPQPQPPRPAAADPPGEFVCPISGRLMADPVILPTGQTFERGCVQACKDLGVVPPGAGDLAAADLLFIPNMNLMTAICNWCDSLGVDRPQPVDSAAAVQLVSGLLTSPSSSATPSPLCSSASIRGAGELEEVATERGEKSKSPANSLRHSCPSPSSPSSPSPTSYLTSTSTTTATSTFTTTTSSSSSSEILSYDSHSPPKSASSRTGSSTALEDEVLARLKDPQVSEQEAALLVLRSATRDGGGDQRAALCTPRLLAALRPVLLSRYPSLQSHAAASLVNLSLHPTNRVRIVRSGAVPALVDVLKSGHPEAEEHSAAALFSLAIEEENRAAMGVLGALPPLLHLVSRTAADVRARQDAAMALYYLSTSGTNRSKLVQLGAVKTLLGILAVAPSEAAAPLLGPALMIVCNLAASGEGRATMMDAGAVEAVVRLLAVAPPPGGGDLAAEMRREYCVAALYRMSRGSMRFLGLASAAGAEDVLRAVVEQEEADADAAERPKRWRLREMARRTLRAASGAVDEDDGGSVCSEDGGASGDGEICRSMSEPVIRTRRRPFNTQCANSTQF